jgi:hypothetical protein
MLAEKLREAFGRFNARDLAGTEQLGAEILGQSPRNPDALHLLGMARLIGGNAREAVSLISRALEANPRERGRWRIGLASGCRRPGTRRSGAAQGP